MPNHETNTVAVIGTPENVEKFLEEAFTDGKIDFQKIVPMPEELQEISAEYQVFPTQEEADAYQREMEEIFSKWPEGVRPSTNTFALTEDQYQALTEKYGPGLSWYHWNLSHWGTKWNAYSHGELEYGKYRSFEGEVYGRADFTFETAWSQPTPVLDAIEARWDVTVYAVTQDEGGSPDVEYGDPYEEEIFTREVKIVPVNWDTKAE